jgi:hypothetical protein
MRCELFAVAESASIDITTNRLSIFHIWDEITTPSLPTMMPSLAIVMMLTREENEPNDVDLQVSVSRNGQTLAQIPATVSFQTMLKARFVATVQGMVFTEQGVYELAVHRGDEPPLGAWRIQVRLVPPAQPQLQPVETVPASPP